MVDFVRAKCTLRQCECSNICAESELHWEVLLVDSEPPVQQVFELFLEDRVGEHVLLLLWNSAHNEAQQHYISSMKH